MKARILIVFVFLICVGVAVARIRTPAQTIDLTSYRLEIADTDEERRRGLSNRDALTPDAGMLFVFDERGIYPFWMKETRIPLDIIWIDGDRVRDVVTLEPPEPDAIIPPSHTPRGMANLVIELNAGTAERLGIRSGVRVVLPER